ncbi:sensor histidine kinase [Agrobacterium sp. ES01]|uniref:sensor histidine kinase n=1 Tax=Agrobacterium sp. ES01 TaxID=3420714 RepID=UPI003D122A66
MMMDSRNQRDPYRILLVDDDDGDRKNIQRVLTRSGLNATFLETSTLNDAFAACQELRFDCTIIDYQMPAGDGLAGIPTLREKWPHMAIIMLTGQGDENVAATAIKQGATDYLVKGNEQSLRQIVESAITRMELLLKIDHQKEDLELFSHVVAHDLMAPTRAIQGFGNFLQRGLLDGDRDKIAINCDRMIKAARRLDTLITTLHAYTGAKDAPEFATVSMENVVQDAIENLNSEITDANAIVKHDPMPEVKGSQVQLVQLIQNLIENSLKYATRDIPRINILATDGDDVWRFSVIDNGSGMADADAEMIFEPFVRADTSTDVFGKGLGLAICRKIVERHGGWISASQHPEGGTTFSFTIAKTL